MKNLNLSSKIALIFLFLFSLILILILIFLFNRRDPIESRELTTVNSSLLERKLLIVSQSSPFKDLITNRVSSHYKSADVVTIDVAELKNTDITEFNAILIVHRWEARAPAESVQTFMIENEDSKNKIVMLTTSWNGLEKMNNVDAITGASIVEDVPIYVDEIIKRLDPLLRQKN